MGIALRRLAAVIASSTIVGGGVLVVSPANAAATVTISGTIELNGATPAKTLYLAACTGDCLSSGDITQAVEVDSGSYSLTVPAGTYSLAVEGLSDEPGYTSSDSASIPGFGGDVYFLQPSGSSRWTVTSSYSSSTRRTFNASAQLDINVGAAIHNPTTEVRLRTSGTIDAETCAGHTTTVSGLRSFTDLPANGRVSYQWYVGTSPENMVAIKGATGLSYRPPASLVGKQLLFEAVGSAPDRVAWDGLFGPLDSVASPGTCVPVPPVLPSADVKSFGKKSGKAVHGKKVSVKKARAVAGVTITYNWTLNGTVVHHGKSYKLPKKAKHKKLAVQVVFTRSGYRPLSRTIKFGKVK